MAFICPGQPGSVQRPSEAVKDRMCLLNRGKVGSKHLVMSQQLLFFFSLVPFPDIHDRLPTVLLDLGEAEVNINLARVSSNPI
jgi:hypothetical protein